MSRYEARHRPRHAPAPAPRSALVGKALGRPAVGSSLALAVVATTAAGVTANASGTDGESAAAGFTVSSEAISQAQELSNARLEDTSRLLADRSAANVSRSVLGERERLHQAAVARAAAEAAARARREAAEKAAREKARRALEAQRAQIIANAISDPRSVAKLLMVDYGWTSSTQFSCLDSLWDKESGWNYKAYNPTSGATGIPQALPGSKMAIMGSDWRTNPITQIKWGLKYINDVYGTPCAAWSHSQATNWY